MKNGKYAPIKNTSCKNVHVISFSSHSLTYCYCYFGPLSFGT